MSVRKDNRRKNQGLTTHDPIEEGINGRIVEAASHIGVATGLSMVMGTVIKLILPRFFPPSDIGNLYFVESIATMVFCLLPFGLPAFIGREIPKDQSRAAVILSTLLPFIVATGGLLLLVLVTAIGWATHERALVGCALGMGLFIMAQTIQRMIVGQVFTSLGLTRVIARLDVGTRVLLVVTIFYLLFLQKDVVWIAFAFGISQLLSLAILTLDANRRGFLSGGFDPRFLKKMIRVSWPFFAVAAIVEIYGSLDISMLRYYTNSDEVAFYGAANKLKGAGLALIPIIQASLQPALSKSWFTDKTQYQRLLSTSLRILVATALPLTLALFMLPDFFSQIVFGPSFHPAIGSILGLAPVLMLTYLNVLMGTCMAIQEMGLAFLVITAASLAINALLNLFMIPYFYMHWGTGAGGLGAGLATLMSEIVVLIAMTARFRGAINGRDLCKRLGQGLLPCLLITTYWLSPFRIDIVARIAAFIVFTSAYLLLTKLVTVDDIRWILWMKFRIDRRRKTS